MLHIRITALRTSNLWCLSCIECHFVVQNLCKIFSMFSSAITFVLLKSIFIWKKRKKIILIQLAKRDKREILLHIYNLSQIERNTRDIYFIQTELYIIIMFYFHELNSCINYLV